jgi:hypothetical protein
VLEPDPNTMRRKVEGKSQCDLSPTDL